MQWSCSRYFLSLTFLHFPCLVFCVWQFQFCRLMLSNWIIASHCCVSVAVFHNSLAAERRSSVKDEIQPRSCESYYRTRTVVNGNSYLWITVWCPSILSFCHCFAIVFLTLSFNSSPSQFSEIVFLKEHQINTTMKTNLPSTALLTWLITWSVVCSRPIGLRRTCCSLPETPYFPPSQFKIHIH